MLTLDVSKQTLSNIPTPILQRLLFLPEWVEPEGFRTLPYVERMKLRASLEDKCELPFVRNCWVWFGEYRGKNLQPMYQEKSVPRTLYELLIKPLPKVTRLSSMTCDYYSDVNPHKRLPGAYTKFTRNGRKMPRRNIVKANEFKRNEEPIIDDLCKQIKELGFDTMLDNPKIVQMLGTFIEGMPPELIQKAVDRLLKSN